MYGVGPTGSGRDNDIDDGEVGTVCRNGLGSGEEAILNRNRIILGSF